MTIALTNDDQSQLKILLRKQAKHGQIHVFVASKRGGNARGRGADRAVILGSFDRKDWFQAAKIWGNRNVERAQELVRQFKLTTPHHE